MEAWVECVRAGMAKLQNLVFVTFGHLGASNLHVVLGSQDPAEFGYFALNTLLYDAVQTFAGSVSAEHGIGLGKREQLHRSRSPEELQLMIQMKKMLDPKNILNPNKIFTANKISAA